MPEALAALRLAARIDLDDLTRSTAGGLHLATMGGLWQALAFGFAGVRPSNDVLRIDPLLPNAGGALELGLRFRGSPLRLRIESGAVTLDAGAPVKAGLGDAPPSTSTRLRFERSGETWKEVAA
jgi:trehalose/maltose hydrolase-like predicted phosphorylase